ncbi:MAG: hypothetical protein HOE02_05600 [Candidatus Marinimicrobia bacterium]|jgi:putative DNA primase/helicase|nr:hypothetical protein [Candidatus Neomarinimicrobiota bacterium]
MENQELKCPQFLNFLKETIQTENEIAIVQEFFGYCFLTENRFEKFLVLLGPGCDGKSTLMGVLHEMLGRDKCSRLSIRDLDDHFSRAQLQGKYVNLFPEIVDQLDFGSFKMILHGNGIPAAIKHQKCFVFDSHCKFVFKTNYLPEHWTQYNGINSRALVVTFKQRFLSGSKTSPPDYFLIDKLLTEMPGIYKWAMDGLTRLLSNAKFTDHVSCVQNVA